MTKKSWPGPSQGEAERERMMGASRQTPDLVSSHARSNPDQDDFCQAPARFWSMAPLYACDGCGGEVHLFWASRGRLLCARCWHAAGAPFPRSQATVAEMHAAEIATRERMQKRGGADRHLVRKGLT